MFVINFFVFVPGGFFDWVEDSHLINFYLQGVSPAVCKIRNYALYTGKNTDNFILTCNTLQELQQFLPKTIISVISYSLESMG